MSETYDCVIIGSGPGGYVAAIRAAQLGLNTAVVERSTALGGRCLHFACIPAKTVLRSADVLTELAAAQALGIEVGEPTVDFGRIAERRSRVIQTLESGVSHLLKKNRITVITGEAALDVNADVIVGDRLLRATHAVILAVGSVRRAIPGIEFGGRIVGTEEAWALESLPESMAVLGAGASGAEVASAYARLGCSVGLFEAADRILPVEDSEISALVLAGLRSDGVDVRVATQVSSVRDEGGRVSFEYDGTPASAEWLIVAAGRSPDVASLGLVEAGVELTESGHVMVDRFQQTSVDRVYAIGDIVPGPALAHKASGEGIVAVEHAAGNTVEPVRLVDVPRATFCHPNVGSFGLTEEASISSGHDVVVGRAKYGAVGAGEVYGEGGFVKIVADRRDGEILGGHIVGARAADLIQELVNVKAIEGGVAEVARAIHSHPTLSEVIAEAARAADGWMIHG